MSIDGWERGEEGGGEGRKGTRLPLDLALQLAHGVFTPVFPVPLRLVLLHLRVPCVQLRLLRLLRLLLGAEGGLPRVDAGDLFEELEDEWRLDGEGGEERRRMMRAGERDGGSGMVDLKTHNRTRVGRRDGRGGGAGSKLREVGWRGGEKAHHSVSPKQLKTDHWMRKQGRGVIGSE